MTVSLCQSEKRGTDKDMDFIIASTSVTDEIRFADKKTVKKVAGGAGIYALCGIKLWSDSVMPVTGVGRDYSSLYGAWYRKNGIPMDGLIVKSDKTPYNVIQYFEDGERSETPLYGPDHYKQIEVTPAELEQYFQTARGIYIFKNSSHDFWQQTVPMLKKRRASVMWEIANDSTCPECLEEVRLIAENVDIFSINLTESCRLFGVGTLEEVIERFCQWKTGMVFLRQGYRGAVMITPNEVSFVPSVKNVDVVDPTGGGNSSSGAVLYGYCSGYSPRECGMMGSIAAAMCLEQFGVPQRIGEGRRRAAHRLLREMKGGDQDEK